MTEDLAEKLTQDVEPFSVSVSGGAFHISQVMVDEGQPLDEVVSLIKGTEEDRWFVMVSENPDVESDSLAMIDDLLEFQVLARGHLKQD